MEWTDGTIAHLRELWQEGHSTAEIGRRMGITKNAVVGKAHRLKLASRPSPIRLERSSAQRRPPPMKRVPRPQVRPAEPPPRLQRAAPPRTVLRAVPAVTSYGRVSSCCWPIGEPGARSFCFCDADTLPGKPYCHEHAQLAYVKVRDKRDTAA